MRFAYVANAWGGVVGTPGAVTDMSSGFYLTPGELEPTLERVAEAGFEGIEVFDGNLMPYGGKTSQLHTALSNTGLELVAVYSGGHFIYPDAHEDESHRFRRSIALAAELGARHYVFGGGAVRAQGRRDEDYSVMADLLDKSAEEASVAGLIPSYHPHLGSLAESTEHIDALFSESKIGLCADIAHLAGGGSNPSDMIQRYQDRLTYVHLKDIDFETKEFRPLGEGDLDLTAVLQAVLDANYSDWITVELDGYPGDQDAAARRNLDYLNKSLLMTTPN